MKEDILDSSEIDTVNPRSWKWVRVVEMVSIALLLLGVSFKYLHWAGGDILTLLAITIMVFLYAVLFVLLIQAQESSKLVIGFTVFAGLTLATTLMGILFKFFLWSGADNMVMSGY